MNSVINVKTFCLRFSQTVACYKVNGGIDMRNEGCILLGLFWLFLFRFRNNGIHGISTSKRTLLHVSDLETESEVT